LIVRRARRPWSVLTEETAGMRAQGSFFSCRYSVGMLPLTPARDDLRGVASRVQCVDRDDRPGQIGERVQQIPDRGDLVRLRGYRHLPEDRADAVRQRRDQVRGLPVLIPRAADGLAVNGDHQPALNLHSPGPQPGSEDLVELVRADQGESAPERGLLRRPRAAPSAASTSGPASAAH
jgi:hypothetical protein